MTLTMNELEHIAKLSSLNLTSEEKERYLSQLDSILDFVSQLNEVNVDWIEPLSHPIEWKYLLPRSWIKDFEYKNELLDNVNHNKKNNWIVIKSPIKS